MTSSTGFAFAFASMACFAANILLSRAATSRMSIEAGFIVMLLANIAFSAALFAAGLPSRTVPFLWSLKGTELFALAGVIGTALARRLFFDTVRTLGAARASVIHSAGPAFTLAAAWLLVGERLGRRELLLVGLVTSGLVLAASGGGESTPTKLTPEGLRRGITIGVTTVFWMGLGNVIRGMAMREWPEPVLGVLVSSSAALAYQIATTRQWGDLRTRFREAARGGVAFYVASGLATATGSIFLTMAMARIKIAIAVLVMHTTPVVIFPVSVIVLKNRECLTARTLTGAVLVLGGVGLLAAR